MFKAVALSALIVIVAAACGDSDTTAGVNTVSSQGTNPESTNDSGSGITIVFEEISLDEGIVAGIPGDWVEDPDFAGLFRPPPGSALDPSVTQYRVSVQCAGACVARTSSEWDAQVQETLFSQFDDASLFDMSRRDSFDGGALVEAVNNFDLVAFQMARWIDGGDEALTCLLSLSNEFAGLVAEFEAACRAVTAPALGS